MSELQKFKDDLGRELVAAAHRRNLAAAAKSARPSPMKPLVGIAVALAVIVVGVVGVPRLFSTLPAAAEAISITELEDRIEIRVIDVVTDPEAVTSKLEDELGLVAEMLAVPSDPALVGQVSAVGTPGPMPAELSFGSDGVVELITLPSGFSGMLIIEYGREAAPGEAYTMTTTDERCDQFYGLTPAESLGPLQDKLGSTLRFEAIAAGRDSTTNIDPGDIPGHYQLVNVEPLSSDSYLISYAEDPDSEYVHPNCN